MCIRDSNWAAEEEAFEKVMDYIKAVRTMRTEMNVHPAKKTSKMCIRDRLYCTGNVRNTVQGRAKHRGRPCPVRLRCGGRGRHTLPAAVHLSLIHIYLWLVLLVTILIGAVYFVLTSWLMKNKLDLE